MRVALNLSRFASIPNSIQKLADFICTATPGKANRTLHKRKVIPIQPPLPPTYPSGKQMPCPILVLYGMAENSVPCDRLGDACRMPVNDRAPLSPPCPCWPASWKCDYFYFIFSFTSARGIGTGFGIVFEPPGSCLFGCRRVTATVYGLLFLEQSFHDRKRTITARKLRAG